MPAKDVLSQWTRGDDEDYFDYYRDTMGGRQYLSKANDSSWEFTQEGYLGILHKASEQNECMRFANNMAPIENLRIANKTAYDFANDCYYMIARTIKNLCSGDADKAEDGLKEVAQLEACLLILRHRLVQRTDYQSTAARGEAVSAQALRIITSFYAELMFGQLDLAGNKIEELIEVAETLEQELEEESGDPGHRS